MNHTTFDHITIPVSYSDSPEVLLSKIGTNGKISDVVHSQSAWNILPSEAREWKTDTQKEVFFFIEEGGGVIRQVLRRMAQRHLRPVVFHEYSAVIEHGTFSTDFIVCLGTMWGKLGREQLLSWKKGAALLLPISFRWRSGTCFPAVHHSGPTNLFPGITRP